MSGVTQVEENDEEATANAVPADDSVQETADAKVDAQPEEPQYKEPMNATEAKEVMAASHNLICTFTWSSSQVMGQPDFMDFLVDSSRIMERALGQVRAQCR